MNLKNEIINEIDILTDKNFESLKQYINKYLHFYKYSNDAITRDVFEEKICDYFDLISYDKARDEVPIDVVCNTLFPLLRVKGNKKNCTSINKYVEKANSIAKAFKKDACTFDDLKDFSRIFLSVYLTSNEKGKDYNDKDFSFVLNNIDFDKTYNLLNKEKNADEEYSNIQYSIIVLTICYFSMVNALIKE